MYFDGLNYVFIILEKYLKYNLGGAVFFEDRLFSFKIDAFDG